MIIHIHSNMTRKNAFEVTAAVYERLRQLGAEIIMSRQLKAYFSELDVKFLSEEEATAACDIIIAIGGDGTILHASHFAAEYDKPILGINAGRLGFLAGLEKQELSLLSELFDGKFSADSRMMLEVSHFSADGSLIDCHFCLNDCTIARGNSLRLCEIEADYDKGKINSFVGDGIIIATPTGSTAYSLSAGGPVVDTAIESLILTPICTHSLFTRSMIFQHSSVIKISVKNTDISLPIFSCDGEQGISLERGEYLEIKKAKRVTKLVKIKSDSFADIFSQKLIERYADTQEENYEKGTT